MRREKVLEPGWLIYPLRDETGTRRLGAKWLRRE
jgi:hypothetical protein